jgi:hypothetical protein
MVHTTQPTRATGFGDTKGGNNLGVTFVGVRSGIIQLQSLVNQQSNLQPSSGIGFKCNPIGYLVTTLLPITGRLVRSIVVPGGYYKNRMYVQ